MARLTPHMKRGSSETAQPEPASARPRTAAHKPGVDAPAHAAPHFPAPGCEASEWIGDRQLILRHGSSLALMADVSEFLNRSQEFSDVDPSADWEKWAARRPGFSLSYYCLVDPARDGQDAIVACLRAVLDGVPSPAPPHRPRMIIDYVTTAPSARGKGLAGLLTTFVRNAAASCGANLYVLALESSCVYWMGHGFVLAEEKNINARLNIFPDTHLLRLADDPQDVGSEDDLELSAAPHGGEEDEAEEDGDSEEEDVGGEGEDGDDEATQLAIALSLAAAGSSADVAVEQEPEPRAPDEVEEDEEVGEDDEDEDEDEDDEEMRAAIALSLAS
jgi:GNAT superfamily N-acetyltransferase